MQVVVIRGSLDPLNLEGSDLTYAAVDIILLSFTF